MFAIKFAKSIKNNPKKSVVAAGALAWAATYARDKYVAFLTVRGECQSAVLLGRQPLNQFQNPTRVSVFINPAANNGKSVKLYEKYAEPILHLAGFKVQLVKLQYEGEAKQLMSVVDDTDIIVSAGGDGTLTEIVTGLLRRPDDNWKKIPIAILPLGKSNTLCKRLLPDADHEKHPHLISAAATAITKQACTPVDVMQIEGSEGKTVYAVNRISWGNYCDVEERARKMWYLGFLKPYAAYFLYYLRGRLDPQTFKVAFSDPCEAPGLVENTDYSTHQQISSSSVLSRIFTRLWPWQSSPSNAPDEIPEPAEESSKFAWHGRESSSVEFTAEANTHLVAGNRDLASIKVFVNSDTASINDFLSQKDHDFSKVQETIDAGSFEVSSNESTSENQYISIDNDRYEAMDLTVKLLPNCIKMVHSPSAV